MKNRFAHKSKSGRNRISPKLRTEIYKRDNGTCQYCGIKYTTNQLSIDHLIPLSLGGRDEITNYVTCCRSCNSRKSNISLPEFAKLIDITLEELPVHGDPVIDNEKLPIQIRLLRKQIYDKGRKGKLRLTSKDAQRRIEKAYGQMLWHSSEGLDFRKEFPNLPRQVIAIMPEIKTIATTEREYLLLIELAKSASTRNLIGTVLKHGGNIELTLVNYRKKVKDEAEKKRIDKAIDRWTKQLRKMQIRNNSNQEA